MLACVSNSGLYVVLNEEYTLVTGLNSGGGGGVGNGGGANGGGGGGGGVV